MNKTGRQAVVLFSFLFRGPVPAGHLQFCLRSGDERSWGLKRKGKKRVSVVVRVRVRVRVSVVVRVRVGVVDRVRVREMSY